MVKEIQLRITIEEEKQPDILTKKSAIKLGLNQDDISGVKILAPNSHLLILPRVIESSPLIKYTPSIYS